MSTSTAWASRPVPQAMSAERLAASVERAVSCTDGLLFTATPTEELDAIGRWQQLTDQAFAGQMREIVAACTRASAQQRGRRQLPLDHPGGLGVPPTTSGVLTPSSQHYVPKLTSAVGRTHAVRPGACWSRQYKFVWAMTCSGAGAPHAL